MKKDLPDDVVTSYGFDNTRFIRASIDEVRQTVYAAIILVLIIFILIFFIIRIFMRIICVIVGVII